MIIDLWIGFIPLRMTDALFVEELTSAPTRSTRSDRYIGYMAETLETLYFMRNSERLEFGGQCGKKGSLNVVHTLCRLYT